MSAENLLLQIQSLPCNFHYRYRLQAQNEIHSVIISATTVSIPLPSVSQCFCKSMPPCWWEGVFLTTHLYGRHLSFWDGVWGRGCDEVEISVRRDSLRRMRTRHSVNEAFGKELCRKGKSVKRSGPFSEPSGARLCKLNRSTLIPFPHLGSYGLYHDAFAEVSWSGVVGTLAS